jgi:hypothetical protein
MISAPFAHVGGLPIEESLGSLGPALLVAFGVAWAQVRARLRQLRTRATEQPTKERGARGRVGLNSNSDDELVPTRSAASPTRRRLVWRRLAHAVRHLPSIDATEWHNSAEEGRAIAVTRMKVSSGAP